MQGRKDRKCEEESEKNKSFVMDVSNMEIESKPNLVLENVKGLVFLCKCGPLLFGLSLAAFGHFEMIIPPTLFRGYLKKSLHIVHYINIRSRFPQSEGETLEKRSYHLNYRSFPPCPEGPSALLDIGSENEILECPR